MCVFARTRTCAHGKGEHSHTTVYMQGQRTTFQSQSSPSTIGSGNRTRVLSLSGKLLLFFLTHWTILLAYFLHLKLLHLHFYLVKNTLSFFFLLSVFFWLKKDCFVILKKENIVKDTKKHVCTYDNWLLWISRRLHNSNSPAYRVWHLSQFVFNFNNQWL